MSRPQDKGTTPQRKLEREMKLGTLTSRRALMERDRAMEAARNPGVSKFGDCLVSINSKSDKMLTSNLRKINSEIRRMQMQVNHRMKQFVKTSKVLNHDPLILVERPPSPEVVKRAQTMADYDNLDVHGYPPMDEDDENKPSFMRQLRSKVKTPSTLTTIDAFTVKTRKKKNVWEGAVGEKEGVQFQSTVRPYAKLTKREVTDLQKGYEYHKPRLENIGYVDKEDDGSNAVLPEPKSTIKDTSSEDEDSDFDDVITPFITQMATVRSKKGHSPERRHMNEIIIRRSPVGSPRSKSTSPTRNSNKHSPVHSAKSPTKSSPTGRKGSAKSSPSMTKSQKGKKTGLPKHLDEKGVRFKSPVIARPKDVTHARKTKTAATVIAY